jgi:xanthine dehydrogenase accessory factor
VASSPILPAFCLPIATADHLPGRVPGGKLVRMASPDHEHEHHEHDDHGHSRHGEHGHVHDASCDVAHGTAPAPTEDRVLVAVFATPVASYLLRYGADVGYRPVLIEPDAERAKEAAADGFELADGLAGVPASRTDFIVTDHHRDELGIQLRDALAADVRWVGIMGNPRHEGPHVAALTELGVSASEISKVHRPIGLNIGSRTPAEIAIATLAGLIADRNGKSGGFAF